MSAPELGCSTMLLTIERDRPSRMSSITEWKATGIVGSGVFVYVCNTQL